MYFYCKGLSRGRFGMEKNKTIKRWMEILWFCWNSIECSNEMHLQLSNCSTSMKINRKCRLLLAEGPFAYKTCFNLNIKGTHSREIPMLRCNVGTNMESGDKYSHRGLSTIHTAASDGNQEQYMGLYAPQFNLIKICTMHMGNIKKNWSRCSQLV